MALLLEAWARKLKSHPLLGRHASGDVHITRWTAQAPVDLCSARESSVSRKASRGEVAVEDPGYSGQWQIQTLRSSYSRNVAMRCPQTRPELQRVSHPDSVSDPAVLYRLHPHPMKQAPRPVFKTSNQPAIVGLNSNFKSRLWDEIRGGL